jgi:hypothetical protein
MASGTLSQPARCKLCGSIIGHFALAWPADTAFNQQEFGRLFKALTQHMQQRAAAGCRQHQGALMHAAALGGNLTQLFIARHFQLPEAADGYMEQCRGSVHHMTSKFTLTPEYAEQLATAVVGECNRLVDNDADDSALVSCVRGAFLALAARYEEGHPTPDTKAN